MFDFAGERDQQPQRIEATVDYDPDARPAMDRYEDKQTPRADAFTLHDLLVVHAERSELDVTIEHRERLGFLLRAVEGVPEDRSAYWALHVDGEPETASLGALPVEEGETYTWRLEEAAGSAPRGPQKATVVVDYGGYREEGPQRSEHEVTYDPDRRPAQDRYEADDRQRSDTYLLHDLLAAWSNETQTSYEVRHDAELGYRLVAVDGVRNATVDGSHSWHLTVDGEPQRAGLDAVEVQANRTYAWTFAAEGEG